MRSPAALLVLAASLLALPARAEEPAAQPAAPAPAAAPPVAQPPRAYAVPYYLPPPWWALPVPVMERRSKGMMITGIVLFGAGGVVTGVGAGLLAASESAGCAEPGEVNGSPPPPGGGPSPRHRRSPGHVGESLGTARQPLDLCGDPSRVNLGLGVLAAGVLGSGVGIPLFVVGNQRERVKHAPDSAQVPVLHVGAGGAELRWSF